FFGEDDNGGRTIVDAGCIAGGHRALLAESRAQLAELLRIEPLQSFVLLHQDGLFGDNGFNGNDLSLKHSLSRSLQSTLKTLDGIIVLLLAAETVSRGAAIAAAAHVHVIIDVP